MTAPLENWKKTALEYFPELREQIAAEEEYTTDGYVINNFWVLLWFEFVEAYQEPVNRDFIARVYKYADWCLDKSGSEEVITATVIDFFELLPVKEPIKWDVHNCMTKEDFIGMQEPFKYHLTSEEFDKFFAINLAKYEQK